MKIMRYSASSLQILLLLLLITACHAQELTTPFEPFSANNTLNQSNQSYNQVETASFGAGQVTEEHALDIALLHAGVDISSVVVEEKDLVQDDGRAVYKFVFSEPAYFSFEYDIDANDGRVLDYKCDWDDAIGQLNNLTDAFSLLEDEAVAIAMEHAGVDINNVSVKEIELLIDNGVGMYHIEFFNELVEYDYLISASSGSLIEYECEWQSYERVDR